MGKILVICGDIWHPVEVIRAGFSGLPEYYDRMVFVEDAKDMLTASDLDAYELVICCKGNHVTGGNSAPWFEEGLNELNPGDFDAYVRKGGGFLAVHGGASFAEARAPENGRRLCQEYIDFVGCEFLWHPVRCPVTYQVLDVKHPVTAGVESFCERDEHYQIRMTAEDAQILMTSASADGENMPAAYVRELGKGRLCCLLPGHVLHVWQNPEFRKLLTNTMNWCMHRDGASGK